jgi:hypothetical protein
MLQSSYFPLQRLRRTWIRPGAFRDSGRVSDGLKVELKVRHGMSGNAPHNQRVTYVAS